MDRDTGSIGALKNPPPVTKAVYFSSVLLDFTGILLMLLIDVKMIFLMIIYIFVSKAYSWTGIRLKKYPVTGWLAVVIFQGAYTFFLVSIAAEKNISFNWFTMQKIEAMLLSTMLIGAYYPLTQIYQHEEDSSRGDFTISFKFGITGTFIFSATMFLISFILALHYFNTFYEIKQFYIFIFCLLPAIIFFLKWFIKTLKDKKEANFKNTMMMTFVSSTCLIVGFLILLFQNHRI